MTVVEGEPLIKGGLFAGGRGAGVDEEPEPPPPPQALRIPRNSIAIPTRISILEPVVDIIQQ